MIESAALADAWGLTVSDGSLRLGTMMGNEREPAGRMNCLFPFQRALFCSYAAPDPAPKLPVLRNNRKVAFAAAKPLRMRAHF
jgi:hypothetical protein